MTDQENTQEQQSMIPVPLNDWSKPPTLMELKQDLSDAKPIHADQVKKIDEWLDNLHVRNGAKPKGANGGSQVQPKLIRKQAEWRYAALSEPFLSTDELFKVKPVSWEDREASQQNQLVLNNQFNTCIDKVRFIDEYVRTAVDEGTVLVRVGWEFVEEKVMIQRPKVQFVLDDTFLPTIEHVGQLQQSSPSQYATDVPEELKQAFELSVEEGAPYRPEIIGMEEVEEMKTIYNRPTVEVCHFKNVVVDPTCKGDLSKANFLVYTFESSIAELKKDGRYKNLDVVRPSDNSILSEPDHQTNVSNGSFNFADNGRKKILVHEYWGYRDIDGSGVLVPIVAAWIGETLIRMEENPFPDKKIPFVAVQFLPVRNSIYGEPDGSLLEDNQKIIGAVTRGMIDIMAKSANGQTGIRKDFLDATNKRKFDKGMDYEFNPGVDPRLGVHMHTYPEIPASAQFMLQLQNMDAESLTGVKSFSQGISSSSLGDVAAAIRGALDAASKRELGILRRLSAGIVAIGRKIIGMNAEFLSEEEIVRVTNDEFVKIRRDDLNGNFDLKLSISTAEEDNNKAEQLAFMLQTMGNNMDPAMMKMLLSDIARLRKMPDLAHAIENYEPQPDPVAQKLQELEIVKIEAEIAKVRAEALKIQKEAGLTDAKVITEGAKARNLDSDSDKKDLDFVEQETGTTQERELQRQGAQARAQAELKVIDFSLKKKLEKSDPLTQYKSARKK